MFTDCRSSPPKWNKAFRVSTKFLTHICTNYKKHWLENWHLKHRALSSADRLLGLAVNRTPSERMARPHVITTQGSPEGKLLSWKCIQFSYLFVLLKGVFQDKDHIVKIHFRGLQTVSDDWNKGIINSQLTSHDSRWLACCSLHMGQNLNAAYILSGPIFFFHKV